MIQEFVDAFMAGQPQLRKRLAEKHPDTYLEIVKAVIALIPQEHGNPNADQIHVIDDGAYQGTLLYVIPEIGYQPDDYWYVKVGYGSCSGCDTLEGIRSYTDDPPTEKQVNDYLTLALHVVQGLTPMQADVVYD